MTQAKLFDKLQNSVSLDDQLLELRREAQVRAEVFPKWVKSGSLSAGQAMRRQARLDAAIATIQQLHDSLQRVDLPTRELYRRQRYTVIDRGRDPRFAVLSEDAKGPVLQAGPFPDLELAISECKRLADGGAEAQ